MVSMPVSLAPVLTGISIYYYKLRFDQINDEIKSIIQKNDLIPFRDQIKLIILIKKHNQLAEKIYQLNMAMRRTICTFFMIISVILNLSLHLIMDANNSFERSLYGQYIASAILAGFGVALLLSMQIKAAHESSKYFYSILSRQKFMFRFQWKVTTHINIHDTTHMKYFNKYKFNIF